MTDDRIAGEIEKAHQWLCDDQYSYGEWGKCEQKDPSSNRTLEASRLKPNVFTSSQAALALKATSLATEGPFERFFHWLETIRSPEGFWTSASGANMPFGPARGWSEVTNIRHTVKALDLMLLKGTFTAGDAPVLLQVLGAQNPNGSFPQHPDAAADIWSTAYAINLMLRARHPAHIDRSVPRGSTASKWASDLSTRLARARTWICDQLIDGLWRLADKNPYWVTEAVLAEVGADLSLNRPDICEQVGEMLFTREEVWRGARLWAGLIVLHALSPPLQKQVHKRLAALNSMDNTDTFDVSCRVRALWMKDEPGLASYSVRRSDGHESLMAEWAPWTKGEYLRWALGNVRVEENLGSLAAPAQKAEAWSFVLSLVHHFKHQIEEKQGWRILTGEDGTLRKEKEIQVAFLNSTSGLCRGNSVIVREPETGRGPVDFEFSNGSHVRTFIEFKRAGSSDAVHGAVTQLPTYMKAAGVDSAILVLVGNQKSHAKKFSDVEEAASELRASQTDLFVASLYIDASKPPSGSVA